MRAAVGSTPIHSRLLSVDSADNMSQTPYIPESNFEIITNLVKDVFTIDQLTLGGSQETYFVQYLGELTKPSEEAFDYLQDVLKPHQLTPILRFKGDQHQLLLRKGLITAPQIKIWTNIILFGITFLSVLFSGMLNSYKGPQTGDLRQIWIQVSGNLGQSLAFAFSLLGILTAHEFGHYFAARYHKTRVTLPFFIPFPLSPFGTMGAFIRMLEPPKNKKVLLDIGLAGPLAGLVVAVPVLVVGLILSPVETLPAVLQEGFMFEGNSILYLVLKYLIHGSWLPEPANYQGLPVLLHWIKYFFTGLPLPAGGLDVMIHPVAWAGWAGILVTSLNLLPAGQLDGGHLIYSLFGDKLRWVRPLVLISLTILGFLWSGWWLWAFLILLLGNRRAEPLDEITELNPGRKTLARLGLVIFFLIFMPVPLISI
jgi:membrane-associated protease RseP (regulator of RpoE activity)